MYERDVDKSRRHHSYAQLKTEHLSGASFVNSSVNQLLQTKPMNSQSLEQPKAKKHSGPNMAQAQNSLFLIQTQKITLLTTYLSSSPQNKHSINKTALRSLVLDQLLNTAYLMEIIGYRMELCSIRTNRVIVSATVAGWEIVDGNIPTCASG